MIAMFDTGTSEDATMDAIEEIRSVTQQQCFVSGMSAVVTDTKNLSGQETPVYVLIAVILCAIILSLTMDSYIIPLFFLLSIGMAIVYNLGSNIFLGEISYITKALAAVLQLGVTLDYSIFL
jgi:predicted RND superfamily exporter protein